MNFKTGILLDNLQIPFKESLNIAAESGADGIQLYAAAHHMSSLNLNLDSAKSIRKMTAEYNLEISAICGDIGGHGFELKDENPSRVE